MTTGGRSSGGRTREVHLKASDFTPLGIALAVLLLVSIGRIQDYFRFLAVLRPGLLLTGVCLAAAILVPRWVRPANLTETWSGKAIVTLGVVIVLSTLTGLSLGASGSFVLTIALPILILYGLLVVGHRTVADLRLIVAAYVASCVFVASQTFLISDSHIIGGVSRVEGVGMYDGNDLGVLYLVGLPLSVVLLRSGGRFVSILGWAGLLLLPASLAMTSSRGGFIGLVVGALAVLFFSSGVSIVKRVTVVAVTVVAFTFAVPPGYWDQMSTILELEEDYNVTDETGRLQIWKRGMGYVAAYPVFGVGPNNFIRAGWEISPQGRSGLVGTTLRDLAPHNTFVQVWAELGTVGFAVWLWLLGGTVVAGWRWRRRFPDSWLRSGSPDQSFMYLMACYLPAMAIGFAATSFFVTHAFTSIFYVMMAIVTGFTLQAPRLLAEARSGLVNAPPTPPRPAARQARRGDAPFALPMPTRLGRGSARHASGPVPLPRANGEPAAPSTRRSPG
jgi:O-antigen ligase